LLERMTKRLGLTVFERMFFEWRCYTLSAEKGKDSKQNNFKALLGDVQLDVSKDGFFVLRGVRDVVISHFSPKSFELMCRLKHAHHSAAWSTHNIAVSRLDAESSHLIPIEFGSGSVEISYRFNVMYGSKSNSRLLSSVAKEMRLTAGQVQSVVSTLSKCITTVRDDNKDEEVDLMKTRRNSRRKASGNSEGSDGMASSSARKSAPMDDLFSSSESPQKSASKSRPRKKGASKASSPPSPPSYRGSKTESRKSKNSKKKKKSKRKYAKK